MMSVGAYMDADVVVMTLVGDPAVFGACEARGSISPKILVASEGVWSLR